MSPPEFNKVAEELKNADRVPLDWFWWGYDYDHKSDTLVLHALAGETERTQSAQLFVHKPQYLQRPALLGRVHYRLGISSGLGVSDNIIARGKYGITIRAFGLSASNVSADFALVCESAEFRSPCGFSHEDFHQTQLTSFGAARDQGTAISAAAILHKIDGKNLAWDSMSSSFTAELVLAVTDEVITHIVFSRPFFINIPKVMHNVVIRPAGEDDFVRISDFFGSRLWVAQQFGRTNYTTYRNNVITIDCDEGWFFLYNQGIGFLYKK